MKKDMMSFHFQLAVASNLRGYILASVHCLQPDVPPENVCAMFEEAIAAGRYPIAV